ncbi:hypothetical protein [Psychrobacter sp. ASPA161_9]|uniref:hypothetical protein n=1 Tax=Psychrobacter sp. ASPA161_9 TaxID=3160961 RepID=UPI003F7DE927
MKTIPDEFLSSAAQVLGDTELGLSGRNIIEFFIEYANNKQVTIPHGEYPFKPNKKDALLANLKVFDAEDQYNIIKELCKHPKLNDPTPQKIATLKAQLADRFGEAFGYTNTKVLNVELVEDTLTWLTNHKRSLKLYRLALAQLGQETFDRNCLDNVRLALEFLLKEILENNKSIEGQKELIGGYIKKNGGSKYFMNMFRTLLNYYTDYQNNLIKHGDEAVEIEFIVELTATFMKALARLHAKSKGTK